MRFRCAYFFFFFNKSWKWITQRLRQPTFTADHPHVIYVNSSFVFSFSSCICKYLLFYRRMWVYHRKHTTSTNLRNRRRRRCTNTKARFNFELISRVGIFLPRTRFKRIAENTKVDSVEDQTFEKTACYDTKERCVHLVFTVVFLFLSLFSIE